MIYYEKMLPARMPPRRRSPVPGSEATMGTRVDRAARDMLPGHPLADKVADAEIRTARRRHDQAAR